MYIYSMEITTKKYRMFAEFENGFEIEIFAGSSKQIKAEQSLFLSEKKDDTYRCFIQKWDNDYEEYLEVNSALSFHN